VSVHFERLTDEDLLSETGLRACINQTKQKMTDTKLLTWWDNYGMECNYITGKKRTLWGFICYLIKNGFLWILNYVICTVKGHRYAKMEEGADKFHCERCGRFIRNLYY